MKILVTGGAGFIGSNYIHYLLANYDDQVINLDKLTYAGNLENLKKVEDADNYQFVKGDISDPAVVNRIVSNGIDYIVNFAAESHVDRSIKGSTKFIKTNVLGTQVLLEAAVNNNVKKFVQISTDEVYGSLGKVGKFSEESPLSPSNPYSASKASADLLVSSYQKTYALSVNITRCSNNYGPYQYPEKLIPLFTINALQDKELPLYGDGKNIRDWLHVKDHCRAVDLVMRYGKDGDIYNVGSNCEMTNLKITNINLDLLGKPDSLIRFVKDRPGHDRRYAVDSGKIKKELGWEAIYDFSGGIRETINWYLRNKSWWKKIKNDDYQNYYKEMYDV